MCAMWGTLLPPLPLLTWRPLLWPPTLALPFLLHVVTTAAVPFPAQATVLRPLAGVGTAPATLAALSLFLLGVTRDGGRPLPDGVNPGNQQQRMYACRILGPWFNCRELREAFDFLWGGVSGARVRFGEIYSTYIIL